MREYCRDFGNDIVAVDSGYLRESFDAIHLIVRASELAIVDTATKFSVARVLEALDQRGLSAANVRWVLLTHVHLDHAGGAGALMQLCPNARLAVHHRGARHMARPEKLWAATCDVYGVDQAEAMYGDLTPVDEARIVALSGGEFLPLGDVGIHVLETPGHAKHHVSYWYEPARAVFVGDTFGIAYPELKCPHDSSKGLTILSSTPTQFDPVAMARSIDDICALQPEAVYMTHYSRQSAVDEIAADLRAMLRHYVTLAEAALRQASAQRREFLQAGLADYYWQCAQAKRLELTREQLLELLAVDLTLNADGLIAWIQTQKAA